MSDIERLRSGMRLVSAAGAAFAEATHDYPRLLGLVARQVAEVIQDTCSVMLVRAEDGALINGASYAADPVVAGQIEHHLATPIARTEPANLQDVLRTGTPFFAPSIDPDALRSTTSARNVEFMKAVGARGAIVVAMRARGESVGLMVMLRHRRESVPFDQLDLEIAQHLANHAALAISNARLVEALREREQLEATRELLVHANAFLDAIVEQIPDMVFVKDAARLAFTRFNRAGEELLGMPRAELIGKSDYDFFPPAQAAFLEAKDRETLAGRVMVEITDEPIQTNHGERWLHTKKVPIIDARGAVTHLLGISQDITDRKRADADLRDAKDRAEAASRELEAFSYSVAHDLRAPLRAIHGFSQALEEDCAATLDEVGRRHLGRVREAAQRMGVLIDDLLELSRVTRAELRRDRIDVSALARTSIARLQRTEPDREVEIVIPSELSADADPRLLAIVFDNLFGNAWKFTSKTARPRIELGTLDRAGAPGFWVRDNGAGFEMAYVDKLFGVFQRLHNERDFPGTGIGLATVARIIRRHRGRVWAEGAPNAGATFLFTLDDAEHT